MFEGPSVNEPGLLYCPFPPTAGAAVCSLRSCADLQELQGTCSGIALVFP